MTDTTLIAALTWCGYHAAAYRWQFPATRHVAITTATEQVGKIAEEALELVEARQHDTPERECEELLHVMQACETRLRQLTRCRGRLWVARRPCYATALR